MMRWLLLRVMIGRPIGPVDGAATCDADAATERSEMGGISMKPMVGILASQVVRTIDVSRPSGAIIEAYKHLTDRAGLVSRALDQLGIASTIPATLLHPAKPGESVVGAAITVRNLPIRDIPYRVWERGDPSLLGEREAFFLARPGDVVVIDGTAVFPASCLGSMSTVMAASLGVAGVIVAGAVTGLAGIRSAAIPVWSMGGTTITGHHRVETVEINGPIGVHGVRVEPGDLVVADDSGVTIVPLPVVEQVLGRAQQMKSSQAGIRNLIEKSADPAILRAELFSWWQEAARLGKLR